MTGQSLLNQIQSSAKIPHSIESFHWKHLTICVILPGTSPRSRDVEACMNHTEVHGADFPNLDALIITLSVRFLLKV